MLCRAAEYGSRGGKGMLGMVDARVWDETKRRIYLLCVVLALPTIPAVTWIRWDTEPAVRVTYPVLTVVIVGLLVGLLTRRISTRAAELSVLTVVPALWLIRLFAVLYLQDDLADAAQVVSESIGPGLAVLAIVAYLALDAQRGLWLAGGFVGAYLVVVLPRVIGEIATVGDATGPALALLRVGITSVVIVALLYALAVLKQRLSAQEARAEAYAELARTDPLTGLPNRRETDARITAALELAARYERPLSLAVLDIDRFKQLNDTAGHALGDRVMCEVASALSAAMRGSDVVGRWGGDEFLVLLSETSVEQAVASLERIRSEISAQVDAGLRAEADPSLMAGAQGPALTSPLTLSMGVAEHLPGDTPESFVARADDALYEAKASGRDRVVAAPTGARTSAPQP